MNIPSIASSSEGSDGSISEGDDDVAPIFSSFNWDATQVEEHTLCLDPPKSEQKVSDAVLAAPGPMCSELHSYGPAIGSRESSTRAGLGECAPPSSPSSSDTCSSPPADTLIQSSTPAHGVGWFSGAAGRLADVSSPSSHTRHLLEEQQRYQSKGRAAAAQDPGQVLHTTEVSATAASTSRGSNQGNDEEQEQLSARFHAMVEAHRPCTEQHAIKDPLVLEDPLAQVEVSELDGLIARLQGGVVMDLKATRPADLPDPHTLFSSDDEGHPYVQPTGAIASTAATATVATVLSMGAGSGTAEAVTAMPQSPSVSLPSPSAAYPQSPGFSPGPSPRPQTLHPVHAHAFAVPPPSKFRIFGAQLPAGSHNPPTAPQRTTAMAGPHPNPRPTVKVDLRASIAELTLQQQQQQQQRQQQADKTAHGQVHAEVTGADEQQDVSGSSSCCSGASSGSDDSAAWAAMRQRMKAQGAALLHGSRQPHCPLTSTPTLDCASAPASQAGGACTSSEGCAVPAPPRPPGSSSGGAGSTAATGVGTSTDDGGVGRATGATRTFFCCTEDLPPVEPLPSPTGAPVPERACQASDRKWRGGCVSSTDGSSSSSSEVEGGECPGGRRVRGAAAARPGAARVLANASQPACDVSGAGRARAGASWQECRPQEGDVAGRPGRPRPAARQDNQGSPMRSRRHDSSPTHASPTPPTAPTQACSTPGQACPSPVQPPSFAYITPNKAYPKPGQWDSSLPASFGTPNDSAACTPPASGAPIPAGTRVPDAADGMDKGSNAAAHEGCAHTQCVRVPRRLAYGLPGLTPGSKHAEEIEGTFYVEAGMRIKYPSGPPPSKLGEQQGEKMATAEAGTSMAGDTAAELSCLA